MFIFNPDLFDKMKSQISVCCLLNKPGWVYLSRRRRIHTIKQNFQQFSCDSHLTGLPPWSLPPYSLFCPHISHTHKQLRLCHLSVQNSKHLITLRENWQPRKSSFSGPWSSLQSYQLSLLPSLQFSHLCHLVLPQHAKHIPTSSLHLLLPPLECFPLIFMSCVPLLH